MFRDFVSLLFPNFCLGCHNALNKNEELICTYCIADLPRTNYHEDHQNPVAVKFYGKVRLKYAFSFLRFTAGGKVQGFLHHLKYKNYPEVGEMFGRFYAHDLINSGLEKEFDFIIPVPLHRFKLKKRGYNQSSCFAKGLSEIMDIPVDEDILSRLKESKTQTKKSRMERWENVKEIFHLNEPGKVKGKRLLVVDDVVTSGSTLEACVGVLQEGDPDEISICTIATA